MSEGIGQSDEVELARETQEWIEEREDHERRNAPAGHGMNPQEVRERAEQEAADQAEERRVARQDKAWQEDRPQREHLGDRSPLPPVPPMPPWLFADKRSQRKAEAMAREERPWDDYSPWQNEQLFR